MEIKKVTHDDLPQAVALLLDEVRGIKAMQLSLQNEIRNLKVMDNRHKPMTVKEAALYTRIPQGTLYEKLIAGEIPATKPGKRYVLYQDELDKWLEVNRKNDVPLTANEENEAILSSHKRKPNKSSWQK